MGFLLVKWLKNCIVVGLLQMEIGDTQSMMHYKIMH